MPKKDIVLYFSPHQDDELLTMGVDISKTCLLENKDVHIILCTDGSKSPARQRLNSGDVCPKHNQIHKCNLSVEDFVKARDFEFVSSCKALGVHSENIHIYEKRAVDGELSVEYAQEIIKHFVSIYGKNAEICTITPFRFFQFQHEDHYNLGLAAKILAKKKEILKTNFFLESNRLGKFSKRIINNIIYDIKKEDITEEIEDKIKKAIDVYYYFNPAEKRYAIGSHCVPFLFEFYKKNMLTYCLKPRIRI